MLHRRDFLASGAALALSSAAHAQPAPGGASAQLSVLLDAFFQERLRQHPETATELGLDKGANAGLKRRLNDVSPAGRAADRAANADRMRRLAAVPRGRLSGMSAIDYDTIQYVEESTRRILALDIGGQDGFSPSPYVISPITGAYSVIPDLLDNSHKIETAADADAYLARMDGFADALDANTEQFRRDTARGAVPADFLLDTTLEQLGKLQVPSSQSEIVQSLARRAHDKGLADRYGEQAAKLFDQRVAPALNQQADALRKVRATAQHEPGVWRFKDGPAFYVANLRYTTTTDMTPEEVHRMGLEQGREVSARLDELLKAQGLTQGTVSQRIQALYKDPKFFYPNTPAGKAQLLADLQVKLDEVRKRLPRMFDRVPSQKIEVRAVPTAIDAGAPGAYSQPPALDGSRPGYIFFNLHDTAESPRWNLSSTLYHEGLPGHQLQGGIALESKDIPLLRRGMYFSGYGEGWALYAEQLADELGMYEDDPLGRIGWLKAQIFRCGRCVVDTGIHTMRWTREQAVRYLMELDGDAVGSTTREVDRYCAIPAQACSYKIGHTTWNRLRDRSRAQLGAKFDIRAFHDAGLVPGAMPLDVLDRAIADWARTVKA